MTEALQKSLKEKPTYDRVPVPFNKEVKKEIEVIIVISRNSIATTFYYYFFFSSGVGNNFL